MIRIPDKKKCPAYVNYSNLGDEAFIKGRINICKNPP